MNRWVLYFVYSLASLAFIWGLDNINHNTKESAAVFIQDKFKHLKENVISASSSLDNVIVIEKIDKSKIYALSDWGINDIQEVFNQSFIVNNTGWYWIIKNNNLHYVVKIKYLYPVNNEYLKDQYATCLDIPDDYKLEYDKNARDIKIQNDVLPIKIVYFPKYKNECLVHLNAILFILWCLMIYVFLVRWKFLVLPELVGLIIVLIIRFLFYKWMPLPLLADSMLFDVKIYAVPNFLFFQYLGDIVLNVLLFMVFSYNVFQKKNKLYNVIVILIGLFLLWLCIYLITQHSSFTIDIIDVLFYNYTHITYTLFALLLIFLLIVYLSYLIIQYLYWSKKHSLYQYGSVLLILLIITSYLVFHYQNKSLHQKINAVFDWVESEDEIAVFEQCQIIDRYLRNITSLSDTDYFKSIQEIENASIYLQLSKRYLFEDSMSISKFLQDKKEIWQNLFIDKNSKENGIDIIYYLNKVNKKYLLSVFEFISPFSNNTFYSFLADKIFQLPSGFKNFDVAVYENENLKFKIGNIPFPKYYQYTQSLFAQFSNYNFETKNTNNKQIIIAYPNKKIKHLISLFSIYWIFILSLLLIGFYLFYSIKHRHSFPIQFVSYSYKITGLVLFVLIISFYLIFIFSYKHIQKSLMSDIKVLLLKQLQDFDLKSMNANQYLMYKSDGNIDHPSISNTLVRYKLIPSYLSNELLQSLKDKRFVFIKRNVGTYTYTSLIAAINTKHQTKFLELSFFDEGIFVEQQLHNLLMPLFNIYALLFLISFLMGILLSNYIVSPIRRISTILKNNNSPLHLNPINYSYDDELGELVKNYNHLVEQLQIALESLKKEQQEKAWKLMAQQVAHDIKNSLTPLLLNIEFLLRQNKEQPLQQKLLNSILQQIQMLSRTAEDFSAYAQDVSISCEFIYLKQLLESIVTQYTQYPHIQIQLDIPNKDISIYSDAHLLSRIILNLLNNAVDAINENGKIKIQIQNKENEIILMIQDNGCGIPKDIKDKIFEPQFSTKTSGKGLGLSIVKTLCDKLNIHIYFESEINQGTTFYLHIPQHFK